MVWLTQCSIIFRYCVHSVTEGGWITSILSILFPSYTCISSQHVKIATTTKKNVERPFIFLNSHTSSGFEGWECKLWAGACWRALAYFDVEQKRGEERKEKEITEESWERKMCCKDREEGSETERERRWGIKKRRGETGSRYIVQLNILSLALPTSVCWINRTVCDNILQGLTAALSHHLLPLPCYNQPQLVHTPTAS